MILTANAIRQAVEANDITIEPFKPELLNPNSYDLTLGESNLLSASDPQVFSQGGVVGSAVGRAMARAGLFEKSLPCTLMPGQFWLAATAERMGSGVLVPQITGKSTLARAGLQVHMTAGFGDLGFVGHWTLEISLAHNAPPLELVPGMRIAQVYFMLPCHNWIPGSPLHNLATAPLDQRPMLYKGKYANEPGPKRANLKGIYPEKTP